MQTTTDTTITLGGIDVRFLVEAQDSGGAATGFECAVQGRAQVPPPHSHDAFDETVYGLEGFLTFTIDGNSRQIGVGDSVCIRRGQVHQFVNTGTLDAKFLSVATPGVFGPDYFTEIRDVLTAATDGPPTLPPYST